MKNSLMRTLLYFAPILFGITLILSSCNEGLHSPITKRQHRKGYDLNFAHKAKPARAIKSEEAEERSIGALESTESVEERGVSNPSMYASSKEDYSQFVIPAEKSKTSFTPIMAVKKSVPSKMLLKNIIKPIAKAKSKAAEARSSESSALSLLWLVIVIVLILWLLAYLTGGWGLGGLIHLLLIIALILLILWLLRII